MPALKIIKNWREYLSENSPVKDIVIISFIGISVFIFALLFNVYENFADWIADYKNSGIGNFFIALIAISFSLIIFSWRRWQELNSEILERKKAQRKMFESKAQLQAVLDGVPDMILQVDKSMRVLWANKAALERNPDAKYRSSHIAFSYPKGSFIDASCRWAIELGRIEKNIMYQPDMVGVDGVSYWETIGVPLRTKEGPVYGAIAIARDITHRMRLEHTWNLLSSIVESTDDAIFGVSWDGTILNWNAGAEKTYGYSTQEIVGKPISILEPVEKRNEIIKFIERVMRKETIERFETERVKKGGKRIIISTTICIFVDATGKKIGISSIDRDITEAKHAEEALKESEIFNKTIIKSVGEGVIVYDSELRYRVWNKFMESLTDISAEEVIDKKAFKIFPHIEQEGITAMLNKALEGKTVFSEGARYYVPKTGKRGWFSGSYSPHISAKGEIIGVVGIIRDITERKLAEQKLLDSEIFNKTIISSVQEGIIVTDRILRYKLWNNFMEEMSGISSEKVIGRRAPAVISFKNGVTMEDLINKALNGASVIAHDTKYEVPETKKSGWLSVSFSPHRSAGGEIIGAVGTVSEITERKRFEEGLFESQTRFRELFDHMSSGVAVMEALNGGEDFVLTNFNKGGEKIENRTKKDIIGLNAKEAFKFFNIGEMFDRVHKVWETGEPELFLLTIKNGASISGWRQNYIYKLPSGEVVTIFDDVTERKRAEQALKESEERYRSFVQNFKGIAFRWTHDFKPVFFHGSVEEITGYTEKEFIEGIVNWDDIIRKEFIGKVNEVSEKVAKIPGYVDEIEYIINTKNGKQKWVLETIQNLCNDEGKIIYIQANIYDITMRKQAEYELKRSREQLRSLALHLETAREEERKKIAFEIHDELGYALTAVKLDLSWLIKKFSQKDDIITKRMIGMTGLVEDTINKVRSISTQLRPSILDHFGISAAIEWQAKEFQKRTAIRTRAFIGPEDIKLEDNLSTAVFRIFQEALTNITRHAKASRVDVKFIENKNLIELMVKDNGIGITAKQINAQKSLGLAGMRERAKNLGGELEIYGEKGAGTSVILRLPVNYNGDKK